MGDCTQELRDMVWRLVHEIPAADIFTCLDEAALAEPAGVDAALCEPGMLRELLRRDPRNPENPVEPLRAEDLPQLPQKITAEIVWHRFFLGASPLNDSARALLTSFGLLGLAPQGRDLGGYRDLLAARPAPELQHAIIKAANLRALAVRRTLFDDNPEPMLREFGGAEVIPVLALEELGADWGDACAHLKQLGLAVKKGLDRVSAEILGTFIMDKLTLSGATMLSFSINQPQNLADKKDYESRLLSKVILPLAHEAGFPLILRIHGLAPEARAVYETLQPFTQGSRRAQILLAGGSRQQAGALLETIRELPGTDYLCGWGGRLALGQRRELYTTALEMLGAGFIPAASGTGSLLRLPGFWAHTRWILGEALVAKYADLARTGWRVGEDDLRRDISRLLVGNALDLLRTQE